MRSETKGLRSLAQSKTMLRLGVAFVVIAVPVVVIACGSEDDTRYGGPAGLSGKKVEPVATSSGATNVGTVSPCDDGGASAIEGGTCAVSFKDTIYGKYINGTWQCTNTNCHGPQGGVAFNPPTIDGTSATNAYISLVQFKSFPGQGTTPYINGCSTDPTQSVMESNLNKASTPAMPQAGAGVSPPGPTTQEILDVETWLKCGAPNN